MKKTYKIVYTEIIAHTFYVDAESEDDARKQFNDMSCELDFSGGYVCDTDISIKEEK